MVDRGVAVVDVGLLELTNRRNRQNNFKACTNFLLVGKNCSLLINDTDHWIAKILA